jgi:hypothetical protein
MGEGMDAWMDEWISPALCCVLCRSNCVGVRPCYLKWFVFNI